MNRYRCPDCGRVINAAGGFHEDCPRKAGVARGHAVDERGVTIFTFTHTCPVSGLQHEWCPACGTVLA